MRIETPAQTKPVKNELSVLFVEDNPAILKAMGLLLETGGNQVFPARDGKEALMHIADGLRPNVLISDYRLPGMNGIEVINQVRTALGNELPAILLTGDTSLEDVDQGSLQRCTLLAKPVAGDLLMSLLQELTASPPAS